tara:strand:- start:1134 stop:1943 length:810 start_codon:yes stop_codon:yes gene_type:complete
MRYKLDRQSGENVKTKRRFERGFPENISDIDDETFDKEWYKLNKKELLKQRKEREETSTKFVEKDVQIMVEGLLQNTLSPPQTSQTRNHDIYTREYNKQLNMKKNYQHILSSPEEHKKLEREEIKKAYHEMVETNPEKLEMLLEYRKDLKEFKTINEFKKKWNSFSENSYIKQLLKIEPNLERFKDIDSMIKKDTNEKKIKSKTELLMKSILQAAPLYEKVKASSSKYENEKYEKNDAAKKLLELKESSSTPSSSTPSSSTPSSSTPTN